MQITMEGKYRTRDGRAVRILATGLNAVFSVAGVITERNGTEHIYAWQEGGGAGDKLNSFSDLVPVPTKHEGWCVLHGLPYIFETKEDTEYQVKVENTHSKRIVAHVTWED